MKKSKHSDSDFDDIKELREYQVNLKDYKENGLLGHGSFGKVWKGKSTVTGWTVAVKEIATSTMTKHDMEVYKREVQILAKCNDQFLLDFIGFTTSPPYAIITSYMPCGSLWDIIHNKRGALTPTQKTNIAMGIAHGMKYLHAHKIIHRDLKSPNVLLDKRSLPKVADFGLGRFVTDCESVQQMTGNIGTPIWMAPELIEAQPYGPPVDVYAYGMILYEMYTEKIPYHKQDKMQIFAAVTTRDARPELPEMESPLSLLIQQCWQRNPALRPTFEEIYHRFETHAVIFPGSETKSIDVLIHEIHQQEQIVKNAVAAAAGNLNQVLAMRRMHKTCGEIQNMLTKMAREGDVYGISKVLAAYLDNADINGLDSDRKAPLHAAVESGQILVVQYLMKIKSIDENKRDGNGNTPLMLAVLYHQIRIAEFLVQCDGVDPNLQNAEGQTALHMIMRIHKDVRVPMVRSLAHGKSVMMTIPDVTGAVPLAGDASLYEMFAKLQNDYNNARKK